MTDKTSLVYSSVIAGGGLAGCIVVTFSDIFQGERVVVPLVGLGMVIGLLSSGVLVSVSWNWPRANKSIRFVLDLIGAGILGFLVSPFGVGVFVYVLWGGLSRGLSRQESFSITFLCSLLFVAVRWVTWKEPQERQAEIGRELPLADDDVFKKFQPSNPERSDAIQRQDEIKRSES